MIDFNNCIAAFPGREVFVKGLDDCFIKEFPVARQIFEIAGQYMDCDISEKCYSEIPIESDWQIICLVTHCYAIYKVMEEQYGLPVAFAGYSQGEFTACAAANAFKFPEILGMILELEKLLVSGDSMDEVMYRFIDIEVEELEKCCDLIDADRKNICISAYISPMQSIVSGKRVYIERLIPLTKLYGARWAINLHSFRAFHSPLCDDAQDRSLPYFLGIQLGEAVRPVYSCYDGAYSMDPVVIRDKLSRQINHSIKWSTIVNSLINHNIQSLVEIGPGCTVSGNTRIADSRINCTWINSTKDLR